MKNAGNMAFLAEKQAKNNHNRESEQIRVKRTLMGTFRKI
jgi:hypothetical protein